MSNALMAYFVVLWCKIPRVVIESTLTPLTQAYMFIDMEKVKNQSDLVESFGTTKKSLLYSKWPKSQYHPILRRAFNACMGDTHVWGMYGMMICSSFHQGFII